MSVAPIINTSLPSSDSTADISLQSIIFSVENLKAITGLKAISSGQKNIILDRLKNEVILKYNFRRDMSQDRPSTSDEFAHRQKLTRKIVRDRLLVGVNQVTRALEQDLEARASTSESNESGRHADNRTRLVILTKDSPKPQTLIGHIPYLINKLNIPIILLSGRQVSLDLGGVVGCKRASVCLFRSSQCVQENTGGCNEVNQDLASICHDDIDSFIEYVQTV